MVTARRVSYKSRSQSQISFQQLNSKYSSQALHLEKKIRSFKTPESIKLSSTSCAFVLLFVFCFRSLEYKIRSCKAQEFYFKYLTTSAAWAVTEQPSPQLQSWRCLVPSLKASALGKPRGRGDIVCALLTCSSLIHTLLGVNICDPGNLELAESKAPGSRLGCVASVSSLVQFGF